MSTILPKQITLVGKVDTIKYCLSSYGNNYWLLRVDEIAEYDQLIQLETKLNAFVEETVIGYDSLLLKISPELDAHDLQAKLANIKLPKGIHSASKLHEISVKYDGPDLSALAHSLGFEVDQLIEKHSNPCYLVRCLGFSPGFGYLDGLPEELRAPRKNIPRTVMAKGAVAIGGSHTGIYTVPSPGGWNWIGNTDYPLFHPYINSTNAFVLRPGDRIKFIPI